MFSDDYFKIIVEEQDDYTCYCIFSAVCGKASYEGALRDSLMKMIFPKLAPGINTVLPSSSYPKGFFIPNPICNIIELALDNIFYTDTDQKADVIIVIGHTDRKSVELISHSESKLS